MVLKVLSREATMRALKLAESSYRPPQIIKLKEEMEAKTRLAEFRASVTGDIDQDIVNEIVAMKLELDALYCAWAEGKIE